MRPALAFHVFDTVLGWMAVAASRTGLVRVVLPAGGRRGALQEVRIQVPGAVEAPVPPRGSLVARAVRQLKEYAAGERTAFDVPLDLGGLSAFTRRVLLACAAIPAGQCRTYGQLAAAAGARGGARAAGQVMRRNPCPIIIPCHRVVAADGRLTGFSAPGGLALKRRLLTHEGIAVRHDRVSQDGRRSLEARGERLGARGWGLEARG